MILQPEFYARKPVEVARDLVGKVLVRVMGGRRISGRILETEAYGGSDDPASHAFRGKTRRNAPMFGPPGRAYVYFVYGNHFCFNVVTAGVGAVLLRSVQPLEGLDIMKKLRGTDDEENLASGPGKLTRAFGITPDFNGLPLCRETGLFIEDDGTRFEVRRTPRIGISRGTERKWRFVACKWRLGQDSNLRPPG